MGESESEDSDAEGGLGNVSRVVMRPPGHSGKAKKGHLCFDASFETGNLGKVDLVSDFEYDLFIRPDTCNPYHRMWFNFTVDNIKTEQRVLFHLVNMSKHRNLYCDGMTPIVRSTSRKTWCRMPSSQVYFYKSPYHRNHYVLTLSFCFDKEEESYQFAFSFPYSYSKCQSYLELVERKKLPYFHRHQLARSLQDRRIDAVSIANPMSANYIENKMRTVLIFSRLHPGDSPSSFICQGIIDFLISNHPIADRLRNRVVFKIIPMMNPDGVALGNFRSNYLGADLNRHWNKVSPYLHPSVHAVTRMIDEMKEEKNMELDFVIDLHAHCNLKGVFVHGYSFEDVYRHERHTLFSKLLSRNIDGYESEYCMFNRDIKKKGSCKRYFSTLKDSLNFYTLYASFYGYFHKNTKKIVAFTEEASCEKLESNFEKNLHIKCLHACHVLGCLNVMDIRKNDNGKHNYEICIFCGKECRDKIHLIAHCERHHRNTQKKLCRFCGRSGFLTLVEKYTHEEVHQLRKNLWRQPVFCGVCSMQFELANQVRDHICEYHEPLSSLPVPSDKDEGSNCSVRSWICPLCPEGFVCTTGSKQRLHNLTIHKNAFKFFCRYCGKLYNNASRTRAHESKCQFRETLTRDPTGKEYIMLWRRAATNDKIRRALDLECHHTFTSLFLHSKDKSEEQLLSRVPTLLRY